MLKILNAIIFSSPSPVPKTNEKPSESIVAEEQEPVVNDTTPRTSLLVGIVFGCLLLRYYFNQLKFIYFEKATKFYILSFDIFFTW